MTNSTCTEPTRSETAELPRQACRLPIALRTDDEPWTAWTGQGWAIFETQTYVRWPVLVPLAALLTLTSVFRWTNADLAVARLFFDAEQHRWPWLHSSICAWFYHCGASPAIVLGVFAVLSLCWAWYRGGAWRSYQGGVFLLVLYGLGPGLMINLALKETWGRPRPHQVREFGGSYDFEPVGSPGVMHRHNSSFPSGHAAVAFYLIAPAFLVDACRPRLAWALMASGFTFGACMGAVRIMQGGHFVSDVVWSAAIVYFTGVLLARLLLKDNPNPAAFRAAMLSSV